MKKLFCTTIAIGVMLTGSLSMATDIADAPELTSPATGDGILMVDESAAAGSRLSRIELDGTATNFLNGVGAFASFSPLSDVLAFGATTTLPSSVGEFNFYAPAIGLAGGAMAFYDNNTTVRYLVDLGTLPTQDDYVVAYDSVNSKFYMKADDGGSMTYPGAGIPVSTGSAWGTSYSLATLKTAMGLDLDDAYTWTGAHTFSGTVTMSGTVNLPSSITLPDDSVDTDQIADGAIVNAGVDASAAIAISKTALIAGRSLTLSTNTVNVDAELYTDAETIFLELPAVETLNEILFFANAVTITAITCTTEASTTTLNIENGTNNVLTADVVCDTDGQAGSVNTSYDNFTAGSWADLDISAIGTDPEKVSIGITFTIDD